MKVSVDTIAAAMPPEITIDEKISPRAAPSAASALSVQRLPATEIKKEFYFLGFKDKSAKLRELWYRWKAIEDWIELAVRPIEIHPDDRCLLANHGNTENDEDGCIDDLGRLRKQCSLVQNLFNDQLSKLSVETTQWESSLVVQTSQIPGAGMGLFYQPISHQEKSERKDKNDGKIILPSGSVICYYTGIVHTHSSASGLEDKSYLMWIRGNTLVDPRTLLHIKARYINDPLNDTLVNCAFCPAKLPNNNEAHEDAIRTWVVATRDIYPGEELFVRYGDVYWSKQPICGSRFVPVTAKEAIGNEEKSDNSSEEDSDDDIDETFPFSPSFFLQNKIMKPTLWETDS